MKRKKKKLIIFNQFKKNLGKRNEIHIVYIFDIK
jgi:hypothetical protein